MVYNIQMDAVSVLSQVKNTWKKKTPASIGKFQSDVKAG